MAWFNSSWQYRKKFATDYTKISGTSQTNFPILVIHPWDADFYGKCRSDGFDIVFTAADGATQLDHEIERFDSGSDMLFWVRVPTLSGTVDQDFYLYYGNPSAADQQDVDGTWDVGFLGVYHCNEASGQLLDSSGNGNHLNVNGSPSRQVAALNGECIEITGTGQNFRASATSIFNFSGNMTISSLVYADNPTASRHQSIAGKGDNQYMMRIDTTQKDLHYFTYNGSGWSGASTGTVFPASAWTYAAARRQSSGYAEVHQNGSIGSDTHTFGMVVDNGAFFQIGANYDFSSRWFDGKIDEVRISDVTRSNNWLYTEHENIRLNSTFYTTPLQAGVGEEEGGYSHIVSTVQPANIGMVNTVLRADILYVNDVARKVFVPGCGPPKLGANKVYETGGPTTTMNTTWTVSAGTDRLLVVTAMVYNSGALVEPSSMPTYGGVAMTLGAFVKGSGGYNVYMFYLVNPTTAAGASFASSWTNSTAPGSLSFAAFEDVDQVTPIAYATNNVSAPVSADTASLVEVEADSCNMIIDGTMIHDGTLAPGNGSGQLTIGNFGVGPSNTFRHCSSYKEANADPTEMSWSWTGATDWIGCGLALKAA